MFGADLDRAKVCIVDAISCGEHPASYSRPPTPMHHLQSLVRSVYSPSHLHTCECAWSKEVGKQALKHGRARIDTPELGEFEKRHPSSCQMRPPNLTSGLSATSTSVYSKMKRDRDRWSYSMWLSCFEWPSVVLPLGKQTIVSRDS